VCESGALYVDVNYLADPNKQDPRYREEKRPAMGLAVWDREMDESEDVFQGEAVYKDFVYDRHAPRRFRKEPIPIIRGSQWFGGWDTCAGTNQPAFALAQLAPYQMIQWVLEIVPTGPCHLEVFAPAVLQALQKLLPGYWSDVQHIGDPAGATGSGIDGKSAFDVIRKHGMHIVACRTQVPAIRQGAVTWSLGDWINQESSNQRDWVPRVIYSEDGCPTLVEAMKGAYCFTTAKGAPTSGPGIVVHKPVKNFYSHIAEAHEYAMVEIFARCFANAQKEATTYAR
jgi:hypothetical protein